ncbi:lipoate-protein ligase A [Bifidobacterium sp. DSM 109958]|uniref:Lipoate-protein ligase A n=1 Tax=Bifidobacterium moraviense TaxID=2675323 RepID=A0A7Y0F270_9BIFI|nr:lipoate--protein ligase family protein [Bifidobacterium sp. DSM 109958]NMN00499.1 lipoate-protein ligase A [Bifidobacterium sp. DSM 109958]
MNTTAWRRGECKMPGGKLVAVSVRPGDVARIDGDFFVEGDADGARTLLDALQRTIGQVSAGDANADVSRETTPHGDDRAGIDRTAPSGRADAWIAAMAARLRKAMDAHPATTLAGADERTIATAAARALGIADAPRPTPARRPTPTTRDDAPDARRSLPDVRRIAGLAVVLDDPREPAMQLALDQACAEAVAAGAMPPLLRFWRWDRAAVVIGRFQSLGSEVHVDRAEAEGVTVVRRITGGGAMFAEPDAVITYSLVAPLDFVEGVDVEDSYRACDGWVLDALRSMGVEARYQPINDIASAHGKIGGAAQRRFPAPHGSHGPGAVLHHTMMSYDMDAAKMLRILNVSREKMSDKAVRSAAKRVDPLRSQTGLAREDVIARMIATLVGGGDGHGNAADASSHEVGSSFPVVRTAADAIPESVLRRARELAADRFSSPAWTAVIP